LSAMSPAIAFSAAQRLGAPKLIKLGA
jgi:hypothetical protein